MEARLDDLERVGHADDEEKKLAHEAILEFLTSPRTPFAPLHYNEQVDYEIYPQKLLPETWHSLREQNLVGRPLDSGDYPSKENTALLLMNTIVI